MEGYKMKIAIVAPSPVPFTIGGAEKLWWGMQNFINTTTTHHCELIKISIKEDTFWNLIDSYYYFYTLDVSHFDLVITTKYPAWMVRHKNHIVYLQHHLRGLFDTYHFCGESEEIPDALKNGMVKTIWDIISEENPTSCSIPVVFDYLFELKSEQKKYAGVLFKFPGPFIRKILHFFDNCALSKENIQRYYCISQNVKQRKDYFPLDAKVTPVYHPPLRNNFRCEQYQYILAVSRLDGPKRMDVLINAMKYVPYDIKFKIAGTGPEMDNLKKIAAHDKRIEFLGFVTENDLVDLYSNALVVLYIPYDEDYGLITIEAMMSNKPVITAKDSGGPLEFVQDKSTGFVVNPDAEEIAEKINFFIHSPEEANKMGSFACSQTARITWDNVISTLLQTQKSDNQRKKILVLSTYSCFPPRGGGQHRLYNLYSRLAKNYEITICSIIESNKEYQNFILPNGLKQVCIPQSREHAEAQWSLERHTGKNIYDISMIDNIEKSDEYIQATKKFISESDIIIFSHPYLFSLKKYVSEDKRIVYDAIDTEYLQKKGYIDDTKLLSKIFSIEQLACSESDMIWTTSKEDSTNLVNLYNISTNKICIVPNGTDTSFVGFIKPKEKILAKKNAGLSHYHTLLFVGSWHPPNLESLVFIIEILAQRLRNKKFLIVGSVKDYYLQQKRTFPDNVLAFGSVDEFEKFELYKLADLALNPMFSGSGTNLKILDYMSAGIPVISTPTGARGVAITHNVHAIICEADNFVDEIENLLAAPEKQESLRQNGRIVVETWYSWDTISKNARDCIKNSFGNTS